MVGYGAAGSGGAAGEGWCLQLRGLGRHGLLVGRSGGAVDLVDWGRCSAVRAFNTGGGPVSALQAVLDGSGEVQDLFAASSTNGVTLFDARMKDPVTRLVDENNVPILSLDSRHGLLASGTELHGIDAKISIFNIKNWNTPLRSLVDSHQDDITCLRFHPEDKDLLLSGSTDGYTNVYDLKHIEEEDSLHQVIKFESIHSCGWLNKKRIYTLSHIETFGIHELNDKSNNAIEPKPKDFGDIREKWGCDYIIDIYPGFIAMGSSSENNSCLKLLPFQNETIDLNPIVNIQNPHNDEIIRDVYIPPSNPNVLYSCGEDDAVKMWNIDTDTRLHTSEEFWNYTVPSQIFNDEIDDPIVDTQPETIITDVPKEKKSSHHRKKSKKRSNKHHFKPY